MVWFHSSSLPKEQAKNSIIEHERILKEFFGIEGYRGVQREAVEAIISGRDALTLMPTGGGKSICYQVPALALDGMALVISPLVALMRDQADRLRQLGVRAAALVSGELMPVQERIEIETAVVSGSIKILYVSPERLASPRFQDLLRGCKLSLVAIDEAHCVCDWGRDFRPDYLRIDEMLAAHPRVPRIALTASASAGMQVEIAARLLADDAVILRGGFDRPNIGLEVVERTDVQDQLGRLLSERLALGSALVYCGSRKQTDEVARLLVAQGFSAAAYHAGMEGTERSKVQDAFVSGTTSIIVATSAFGMGIDKSDVATVAHVGLPASIEAYYQESGRAGRDGRESLAWLAWSKADIGRRMRIVHAGDDDERKRRELVQFEAVMSYVEAPGCRRNALLQRFGQAMTDNCGRCDVCLGAAVRRNATADVTLALEAIFDLRQDASMGMTTEVLAGMASARVNAAAAERLPQFGSLRRLGDGEVRKLLRQCLALGLIDMDDRTGTLAVSTRGEAVMDGATVELPQGEARRTREVGEGLPQWRVDLWRDLAEIRDRVAADRGLQKSLVASDAILAEIVASQRLPERLPQDLQEAFSIALGQHTALQPSAPTMIDTGLF